MAGRKRAGKLRPHRSREAAAPRTDVERRRRRGLPPSGATETEEPLFGPSDFCRIERWSLPPTQRRTLVINRRRCLFLVLGTLTTLAVAPTLTAAETLKKGALEFVDPWARATAPDQRNGAAYVTIRNHGEADRILRAEATVSRKVELHTHQVDAQGVARMIEVPAIELPAHTTTELKPGGLHIMLIGLEEPLQAGRRFALKLILEKAGEVTLDVEVRTGSRVGPMRHGAGHGGHGANY